MKKIAIVGCYESGLNAPFYDESYDIWTMNFGVLKYDKIDLLFDLHQWIGSPYIPTYYDKLKNIDTPVIKLIHDENIKNEIILKEIDVIRILKFKPCTTVSYMIAYAIMKKAEQIDFHGITSEFYELRPQQGFALARSVGVAESNGIKCNLHNFYLGEDVENKRNIHWFGIYRGGYID